MEQSKVRNFIYLNFLINDRGANVNYQNHEGVTALMNAVSIGCVENVQVLLLSKADTNIADHSGKTALHYALYNEKILALLIDFGAHVDAKNKQGMTALMINAREGRADAVKILLDNEADIDQKNNQGYTAFDFAIDKKRDKVLSLLNSHKENMILSEQIKSSNEMQKVNF